MTKGGVGLVLAFLFCSWLPASSLAAQQVTISYDAFMSLDANERLDTFGRLSPQNCVDLLKEQLTRWRRLNAARLTAEQNAGLDAVEAFLGPAQFGATRHRPEEVQAFLALSKQVSEAFTPADAAEAFTLRGSPLPAR
jgi:hypothetical protein